MIFDVLVWAGMALSLVGLVGLILSARQVQRARKAHADDDDALRAAVQKALPLNMGALFLSVFGLMMVVLGVFLR